MTFLKRLPSEFWLVLILTISYLIIYLQGISPFPTHYGDSGELLTVGNLGGVAHPSGYPVAVEVIFTLSKLFPHVPPALLGKITAAVVQSLALGITASVLLNLIKLFSATSKSPKLLRFAAVSICISILAFSPLFWLYGTVIEVISFTNLFVAMLMYVMTLWLLKGRGIDRYLFLSAASFGFALAHVHTVILLFPGLLILFLAKIWNDWPSIASVKKTVTGLFIAAIIIIVSFILPNLLLFSQNVRKADVSWYFSQNLQGWVRHILRRDYAGYYFEDQKERPAYWTGFSSKIIKSQPEYLSYLNQHLTPLILVMGAFGASVLIKRKSRLYGLGVIALFLVSGSFMAGYMGIPPEDPQNVERPILIGVLQRQYLTGELMLTLIAGIGLTLALENSKKRFGMTGAFIIGGVIASVLPWQIVNNINMGNQKDNKIVTATAHATLNSVKPGSVIICGSDLACYSLLYASVIEKVRPDVTVLTNSRRYRRYFRETHPQFYGIVDQENPYYYANIISFNVAKRPTYITTPTRFYIEFIGLSGNPFYLIPHSYIYEVVTSPPDVLLKPDYAEMDELLQLNIDDDDFFRQGIKDYFANNIFFQSQLYTYLGQADYAKVASTYAINLKPEYPELQQWLSQPLSDPSFYLFSPDQTSQSATFISFYEQALKDKDINRAYESLRKAIYMEPENVEYRLILARFYFDYQYYREAQEELDYVVLLDPGNSDASILQAQLDNSKPIIN